MLDVKTTISNAIEYCYSSSDLDKTLSAVTEKLKSQDCLLHSKFRYSIANDIARYVFSSYGYIIKAVKLYGSTMEYNAGKFSDIDMIVHVEKMSEEIESNIKMLDQILTHEYYLLINEETDPYSYLIDVHIIDESRYTQDNSKSYLMYILNNNSVPLGV